MNHLSSSTRGADTHTPFPQVILGGLASDKGLFIPDSLPFLSLQEWKHLEDLSYPELAAHILSLFSGDSLPHDTLASLASQSLKTFSHPDIAPLTPIGDNLSFLELYHGPTLAFKDFALQTLAQLFTHFLTSQQQKLIIIGATSGDTGSAAIEACRHHPSLHIFMLHPLSRTSTLQRLQMTTVQAPNVHNIAIQGSFDDCQRIAKNLLHNQELQAIASQRNASLSAVNSINWGRILAQIIYYVYAALRTGCTEKPVSFAVPSGNFGNIFAGFIAKSMGLPIHRLIIATNHNNILERILKNASASNEDVIPSLSPSMDIQVSSNFERLIFLLSHRNPSQTREIMISQEQNHKLTLPPSLHAQLSLHFDAFSLNDEHTLKTIQHYHQHHNLLIDPHSAIGLKAAEQTLASDPHHHIIALGTAHPAKFPHTVAKATGHTPTHPLLSSLPSLPESFTTLNNNTALVQSHITQLVTSL